MSSKTAKSSLSPKSPTELNKIVENEFTLTRLTSFNEVFNEESSDDSEIEEKKEVTKPSKEHSNNENSLSFSDVIESILEDDKQKKENINLKTNFNGIWKLQTNDNFDKYCQEIGITLSKKWSIRTFIPVLSMIYRISHDLKDDLINIKCNFKYFPGVSDTNTKYKMNNLYIQNVNLLGEKELTKCEWNSNFNKIIVQILNANDNLKNGYRELYIKDGLLYDILTNFKGTVNKRIFKKVENGNHI